MQNDIEMILIPLEVEDLQHLASLSTSNTQETSQRVNHQHVPTTTALAVMNTTRSCPFCHGNDHRATQCKLPLSERISAIANINGCNRCLRPGHSTANCKNLTMNPCPVCNHVALCEQAQPRMTLQNSLNACASGEVPVLLQTATAWIKGPRGEQYKARCFLDLGVQRSFITKDLARRIGLVPNGTKQ